MLVVLALFVLFGEAFLEGHEALLDKLHVSVGRFFEILSLVSELEYQRLVDKFVCDVIAMESGDWHFRQD